MPSAIRIDQALFGYGEGHRLLQASRRFSSGAERTLLILTDMSGPRIVEGFEEYVSGYPLDGEDSYAVVKTWYAPEMERPGCVWSHVLIISNSDLAFIRDVSALIPMFKRPTELQKDQYRSPLLLDKSATFSTGSQVPYPGQLLIALYGQEQKPVIILATDSYAFQAAVFGIWSQQWPILRQSFSFCTGSLSNRVLSGHTFDLQVAPFRLQHELQRDSNAFVLDVNSPVFANPESCDSWLPAALDDLATQGGPLRNFLWKYADVRMRGRSLFAKLSELYLAIQKVTSNPDNEKQKVLSGVTRQIALVYPSSSDGTTLKQDFYGYRVQNSGFWKIIDERTIVTELATTPLYESLDASQLQLRARASTCWEVDRQFAESLLFSLLERSTTPFADQIMAGFVDGMDGEDVRHLATIRSGLLLALTVRNSKILNTSEFWKCSPNPDVYYAILDYLRTDEGAGITREWISNAIDNGPSELAAPLLKSFAAETVHAILRRASTGAVGSDWIPTPAWRAALAAHQSVLIASLDQPVITSSVQAMTLLAGLLDSHEPSLKPYGLRPWLELTKEAKDLVLGFPNAEAAAFLLSLGYTYGEAQAIDLIEACFEHVHASALNNASDPISYRAWKALERDVPTMKKNWDKCGRLRLALLGAFLRNQWPPVDVLRCVTRPGTWRDIYHSWDDARGGEQFLERVADAVFNGRPDVTREQRALFQSCFHRNYRGVLKPND
jgi:hypothetical protein